MVSVHRLLAAGWRQSYHLRLSIGLQRMATQLIAAPRLKRVADGLLMSLANIVWVILILALTMSMCAALLNASPAVPTALKARQ